MGKSEEVGFNVKWLRQRINTIKKAIENNVPFLIDVVVEKEAKIARLTKELEMEKATLQVLKNADEHKSYFADFL